ncbi:MAG: hypothetical protein JNM17_25725 [Archangium sp.]|nr:hypothetical protein [Archangium sp.]
MRRVLALLVLAISVPAFAQKEEIFGDGAPPRYREENMDKRFKKTRVAKLLENGTDDPACIQMLGGLFVALAEIAPVLHKRDENFTLAPELTDAVQTQLSTPGFPATAYLVAMIRKIMIDGRLPDTWLETAIKLNKVVKIIDIPKLKMINEQINLVDSSYLTILKVKERYMVEALNANSAVTTDVVATFRDAYLDRPIAWGGATLLDIGINQPKGKKGKKKLYLRATAEELVAVLQYIPPDPRMNTVNLLAQAPVKVDPIIIYVKLQSKQYADIEKFHRGQRVMVKGHFWEMSKNALELEVRDGLLFEDRDWSGGVLLGRPEDVAQCPAAINEITGTAPAQVGGFKH